MVLWSHALDHSGIGSPFGAIAFLTIPLHLPSPMLVVTVIYKLNVIFLLFVPYPSSWISAI